MSDEEYQKQFDTDDIVSSTGSETDDLFSTSENQLDLNSFILSDDEEKESPKYTRKDKKGNNFKKGKKRLWQTVLSVFLVLTITFCLVVGSFIIYVFGFIDDDIQENLYDLKLDYTTTIYVKDKNADTYKEYQRVHGGENRIWVSYDKEKATAKAADYNGIPQMLADAFTDIEDERFWEHQGVDWKRTAGAFANMFLHFWSSNQGGSTITQQLVKNLTSDKQQNAMRKIREIMRARKIESKVDKNTILECYLNTVTFAHGIGGVEVASNYYFNKSVNELTLAECASLAAIVKEPERYRPDKYPENNAARKVTVLKKMRSFGHITKEEYEQAKNEEVKIIADDSLIKEVEINSYFVDALIDDVVDDLVEKFDCDESYAEQNFYNGGYKIYCTLDTDIQSIIDEYYTDESNFHNSSKGQKGQSAFTVMDYNGHVVGIAGGTGKKTTNRGLNRATSSPRSPGSTMKPMASYSLALDNNLITYSTIFKDQPITLADGKKWPPNWYGYYGGSVTVAKALERSINTVPAQLVEKMSIESVFDHLTNDMKISTLKRDGNADLTYSSMALGSCYKGVTTLEACAAFSTFGNKGKHYEPTFYTKVTDQHGNVVLDGEKTPSIAMSEDTAVIMNHLLRNVVDGSQGTGKAVRSYFPKMPIYAKTGTTNENENCWLSGGTPYYVASCWYGYDTPEAVSGSYSGTATKTWAKIMSKIHKNLPYKEFDESEYVTCRRYCTASGMVATSNCSSTAVGWYKTSNLAPCTMHGGKALDEVTKEQLAAAATASSNTSSTSSATTSSQSTPAQTSNTSPSASVTASTKPVTSTAPTPTPAPNPTPAPTNNTSTAGNTSAVNASTTQ